MNNIDISSLSAFEYLQYLQDQHFKEGQAQISADVCDLLTANLIGALPPEHRRMIEQIPVGVLPTKNPNAVVIAVPSGGQVIAIDYGLMSLLTTLNKILLCRLTSFGFEPSLETQGAARIASDAVNSFFAGQTKLPRWPIAPKRMLVASTLSNVQTSFVIGHELSHVLLGHLGPSMRANIVPDNNLNIDTFSFVHLQQQELAADERGAELIFEHFGKTYDPIFGSTEPVYAQAGMDILFTYFLFMQDILGMPSDTHTHPSPEARKKALRDRYWSQIPEVSRKLAQDAEKIFAGFLSILER
jgi:hypothetical protein